MPQIKNLQHYFELEKPHKYTFRTLVEKFKHVPGDGSGYLSDDFAWSDEAIIKDLLEIRASTIDDYLSIGKNLSDQVIQVLPCVEVEEHDRNECPCFIPSGCYWLKTKLPIPKFIKITSVTGIVANADMPRFSPIKWDRIQYIPNHRIASVKNGLYWTTRDSGEGRYLYLYGNRDLEKIAVSGIWENPMEAAAFPNCGIVDKEALCNPLDVEVFTDIKLLDRIMQTAWSKLLPVRQTAPVDIKNNDNPKL